MAKTECLVNQDPRREKIIRDLILEHKTLQQIADEYNYSRRTLEEYKRKYLRVQMALAAEKADEEAGKTALSYSHELIKNAVGKADEAHGAAEFSAGAQYLGVAAGLIKTLATIKEEGGFKRETIATAPSQQNVLVKVFQMPKIARPSELPALSAPAIDVGTIAPKRRGGRPPKREKKLSREEMQARLRERLQKMEESYQEEEVHAMGAIEDED